ncbi:hypothetical protein EDD90_2834 [Streptomyces sp. Ag109_O5-1]|uniref:hypothetical protein n=1 Tax=Streptomyces sp. Ag109_O5-1 TaxID=1938851 RepID=UPI000F50A8A6|nr:hypothetical protein [Streptomyces sp. Ag109_O5-1]RPE39816.1 hypothetical protein EDD90_2834 [Streptomyces sp. Ag109_O5-1]
MTNLKTRALEEAVLNVLEKKVGDALTAARAATQAALEDSDVERQGVRLPDGTKVAAISVVNPDAKPDVSDKDKLVAWVAEHAPGEIVEETITVRRVRPAYLTALVKTMTERQAAEVVLESGEIVTVPGVTMKEGTRTHSLRFEGGDAGRALVAAAWASDQLRHLTALGELVAGGAE